MLNYSTLIEEGLHLHALSDQKFGESQVIRMDYILYAKQSGDKFLQIKKALDGAKVTKPVTLDGVGTFTSFHNFCCFMEQTYGVKESTIKGYVTLAENWEIVIKLGMQDKDTVSGLRKSMRVARTLKIIRWYKKKIEDKVPEEELSIDLYWQEMDALEAAAHGMSVDADGAVVEMPVLTKKQLSQRVEDLERELSIAKTTISQLQAELAKTKSPLPLLEWRTQFAR